MTAIHQEPSDGFNHWPGNYYLDKGEVTSGNHSSLNNVHTASRQLSSFVKHFGMLVLLILWFFPAFTLAGDGLPDV